MSGDHVHSILPGMEGGHEHPEITRRLAAIENRVGESEMSHRGLTCEAAEVDRVENFKAAMEAREALRELIEVDRLMDENPGIASAFVDPDFLMRWGDALRNAKRLLGYADRTSAQPATVKSSPLGPVLTAGSDLPDDRTFRKRPDPPRLSTVERHRLNPTLSERLTGEPCAACAEAYSANRLAEEESA